MIYIVRLVKYKTPSEDHILEHPDDIDLDDLHKKWSASVEDLIGPEPNILCFGDHAAWLQRRLSITDSFVTYLIQSKGFKLHKAKRLTLGA